MQHAHPPARPASLPLHAIPQRALGVFWRPTSEFVDSLALALRGMRVLEVFAGNGYLAAMLSARGIDITATSILSGMDAHESGLYHPVIPMEAVEAACLFKDGHDALLMCWPTVTEAALRCALAFGPGRPIAYIGESTDYAKGHLGGCATDSFHANFSFQMDLPYQGNCMERAGIGRIATGPSSRPPRPSTPGQTPPHAPK